MRVQFRKIVDIFGYNDQLNALLLQFKIRNTHTSIIKMIKFDAHSSFTIAIFGSLLDEYEIQKN